ncbi:MAG: GDP-L-fucose synthetase [Gemmatimonadetes bacterium]|nr:GDP-L-fucose synthetase [Gemmatimonadota bacterium]
MRLTDKIYVAGHRGLVGSALVRRLVDAGYSALLLRPRAELDLEDQRRVFEFFEETRPRYVFLAAAKVGGIHANNTLPAEFIRSNLAIQCNVIEAAHRYGVEKLMFLGSSCIYPRQAVQPITEDALLSGYLEPTNQPYAVAKIAGIEMCQAYHRQYGSNFISVMPTNLYGPGDNFDLLNSHVLPALIRKFHEARVQGAPSVPIWGTGNARREFLYVDDMAEACVFLMERYDDPMHIVNIGCGEDIRIGELAELVKGVVGYEGDVVYDTSKPDGPPRKLLDIARLQALGWRPRTPLQSGIERAYAAFLMSVRPNEASCQNPTDARVVAHS